MFVLPQLIDINPQLPLSNSMQVIFMPFSGKSLIAIVHYPDSLSLTLCIKVASVLALYTFIDTIFVLNIYEPFFDGLKFRLKQPLKLFDVGYTENCILKHLEAIVNLHYSLTFSLHNHLKTLMCRS